MKVFSVSKEKEMVQYCFFKNGIGLIPIKLRALTFELETLET